MTLCGTWCSTIITGPIWALWSPPHCESARVYTDHCQVEEDFQEVREEVRQRHVSDHWSMQAEVWFVDFYIEFKWCFILKLNDYYDQYRLLWECVHHTISQRCENIRVQSLCKIWQKIWKIQRHDYHNYIKNGSSCKKANPSISPLLNPKSCFVLKHFQETLYYSFMVVEVYGDSVHEQIQYYDSGADMPFNFNLLFTNRTCGGRCVRRLVDSWMYALPDGKWANWVVSNFTQNCLKAGTMMQL